MKALDKDRNRRYRTAVQFAEDHDADLETCEESKSRLGQSAPGRYLYLYARALALDLQSKSTLAVDPANRVFELGGKTHHMDTVATAHLCAGNWDDAISWANRALEEDNWDSDVCDWLVLAIALYEKGEDEKADEWMAKSVEWFRENERKLQLANPAGLPIHAHNWLAAQILRREAIHRLDYTQKLTTRRSKHE